MIVWLLLGGIFANGLLQMFAEAVPPRHRFTYQIVASALCGLFVIAAGVLLFQQPPWTAPDAHSSEGGNTHGGRGGIVFLIVMAAVAVGPQITGVAVAGFGLLMIWPFIRDRLASGQRA